MKNEYIERIIEIRKEQGYSQKEIAELLNTTQQQYAKYEKGIQEIPTRRIIELAKIFNVTSDYILGVTNEKRPLKK